MRRRVWFAPLLLTLALLVGACGGDDDDGEAGGEASSSGGEAEGGGDGGGGDGGEVPPECTGGPVTIAIDGGEALPGVEGPTFDGVSTIVAQQPIVPDPDGELELEDVQQAAEDTELVAYTVYVADFPLEEEDASTIGLVDPPEGGTFFGFSIVPPTDAGIAEGDVIRGGRPSFESRTTFGNVGTQYGTALAEDEPSLATETDAGVVEVLHLDDERICLSWTQEGTLFGAGADPTAEWSIDGAVIGGPLAPRSTLPYG